MVTLHPYDVSDIFVALSNHVLIILKDGIEGGINVDFG